MRSRDNAAVCRTLVFHSEHKFLIYCLQIIEKIYIMKAGSEIFVLSLLECDEKLLRNNIDQNNDHLSSNQGAGKAVQILKGVMMQCVCLCLCVYCKKKSQVSKVRRAGFDAETVAQRRASLLGIIAGSHPSAGGLALVPPPRLRDTDQMCHHQYLEGPGAA